MISLLPSHHETIVLPHSAETIFRKMYWATSDKPFMQPNEQNLKFNGWVKEEKFRISVRVHRANNYLPLVIGEIESTSSGCILFIDYKLFPTTRMLLVLWTILLVLGALIFSYQTKNIIYLAGGLAVIALIHFVVWSNFNLQLDITRKALHKLLIE
ncbi:MAG TPA: hypothetical protein VG737_10020 [Cyclobacteriaceae bacterium]|nr:hypothetical protein [Cyclobacteriaceae bacterium]